MQRFFVFNKGFFMFIKVGGNPTSRASAHTKPATVATFRSWRGSQADIAK